jgi:predicted small lipoprotein YifL
MKRGFATALVALAAAALVACGSSDAGPLSDDSDKQAAALACLTDEKGLDAREDGDTEVVVDGARIRFYLTAAEAEAAQFRGDGEGAEQIGQALLFVEPEVTAEGEELLEDVEACLQDL